MRAQKPAAIESRSREITVDCTGLIRKFGPRSEVVSVEGTSEGAPNEPDVVPMEFRNLLRKYFTVDGLNAFRRERPRVRRQDDFAFRQAQVGPEISCRTAVDK
jgi:hypothetical protein